MEVGLEGRFQRILKAGVDILSAIILLHLRISKNFSIIQNLLFLHCLLFLNLYLVFFLRRSFALVTQAGV